MYTRMIRTTSPRTIGIRNKNMTTSPISMAKIAAMDIGSVESTSWDNALKWDLVLLSGQKTVYKSVVVEPTVMGRIYWYL